jgi:hypothetical protein
MAQHRSILLVALLLTLACALALGAASFDRRATVSRSAPQVAITTPAPAAPPRVCVTAEGLCGAPFVPAGDPCRCPHPLRGMVPGHVELLGHEPRRPRSSHWARTAPADELYDWDGLVGP